MDIDTGDSPPISEMAHTLSLKCAALGTKKKELKLLEKACIIVRDVYHGQVQHLKTHNLGKDCVFTIEH